MRFNMNDYPQLSVMHCKTEHEAQDFCKYLDEMGFTWSGGGRYSNNVHFHKYGDETCYNYNDGKYCNIDYYIEEGYTILTYSDFDWSSDIEPTEKEVKKIDTFISQFVIN